MYLSDLALNDFRNYEEALVRFTPGVMVLEGNNGHGKTNIVEAIGYLSALQSHRVAADAALVRVGQPRAVVRAKVCRAGREALLEIEIVAGRANRARLNRAPLRPRELLGVVKAVTFAPEDLALVKGDPGERRRFLDELVFARTPRLAGVKSDYDKVLRQRSALLKQARSRKVEYLESTLEVWDEQLAATGAELMLARAELVTKLRPHVAAAYHAVAEGRGLAGLQLDTSLARSEAPAGAAREQVRTPSGPLAPREGAGAETGNHGINLPEKEGLRLRLRAAMRGLRRAEIERGQCLVGPHRDDLALSIGGLAAKGYASHGESWSLALALRLASFELLKEDDDESPILILDDVFAELDTRRRDKLASLVLAAEQVFVTAAVGRDVPAALAGTRYRVVEGTIEAAQ